MNKMKLSLYILLSVAVIGIIVFGIHALIPGYTQAQAKNQWQQANTSSAQIVTFHYNVLVEGKDKNSLNYTQKVSGDYKSDKEIKGSYDSDNGQVKLHTQFVVNDQKVYSKEGNLGRWFIWSLKDYPEAVFYVPTDLISAAANALFLKNETLSGVKTTVFQSSVGQLKCLDDVDYTNIKLWLNKDNKLLQKAELTGMQNNFTITKTITFTDYGKQVDIQLPKDEELAK